MEDVKIEKRAFKTGHTLWQWIFSFLASATLFTHGMECGWISPTTKILQSIESPTGYPLSDNMIVWVASSMSMAAIFGVPFYSHIADKYGRKSCLILIASTHSVSWILRLSYSALTTLIIARLLSGLAAGGCFNIAPMYIKEISEDNIRGTLVSLPLLMQNIGLLVMYLYGAYFHYRTVIISASIVPIVTIIFLIKAPESPEFLVKMEKLERAKTTVALLKGLKRDDKIIESIIEGIQNEAAFYKSLPNISLYQILKDKKWRRGVILILVLFFFHALNGTFAIITYASAILFSTGVQFDISPEIQTISFPTVLLLGSLALTAVVEKCGRKPLLVSTFAISSLSMGTIAVLMYATEQGRAVPDWLPVVAMMVSVAMLGAGVSPLPYIILTEMFSFQIRAKVVGTVVTFAWFLSFVLVAAYTPLADLAQFSPFVLYCIINLAGAVFTLIFLPETKGKSEEEILRSLK